jgi:hypothetical protein
MTSEPEGKPGRRPPTIELTATEIDKPASPQTTATAEPPASGGDKPNGKPAGGDSGNRLKSHAISVMSGAIATAAIVAGLWFAGLAPSRQAAAPPSTTAPAPGIAADVAARPQQTQSLGDSIAALSRRLDDIAGTAQTAQKTAETAAAMADAAKNAAQTGVQRGDIDALTSRIAALESALKALADDLAQRTPAVDDRAARLTVVAEALHAAVERGAPYQAELAAAKSLGADQTLTAALEPFAAAGLPSAAALAHELAALMPALERASDAAPGDESFLGRLQAHAERLVRISPVEAPPGNDPAAVLARIDLDIGRADIAAALADISILPDATKSLAADWVKKAETRQAAVAAARNIAAAALAALGKPATQ